MYRIETMPNGFSVRRRFSDFVWLRQYFEREFPAVYIPPMAKKKSSSIAPQFLRKRMQTLQQFVSSVTKVEILRKSVGFLSFVKIESHQEFKRTTNTLDKQKSRISVQKNYG